MSSLALVAPVAVAIAVPLVFLFLVRRLDLYASGSFAAVFGCFVAGLLAFLAAHLVNTRFLELLLGLGVALATARMVLRTVFAPIAEEILKSLGVVFYERRPEFTYFVDGAIYGFAAGTAFAIIENVDYVRHAASGVALGLSVNRAFTTSLMHGGATALVGVAIGRFRYGKGRTRRAALVLGWTAAIALHMAFNTLVNAGPVTPPILVGAYAIGLGAVGLTMLFIRLGLREEQRWLRESLGLDIGVTAGESEAVQQLADIDELLAPVEQSFGREKRDQVETFLRLQARLGLKRKAWALSEDPDRKAALAGQVDGLREEMDDQRRAVGVYCMAYVRSILPPEAEPLWGQLEANVDEVARRRADEGGGADLWAALGDRTGDG